jgi:hypothetical protein
LRASSSYTYVSSAPDSEKLLTTGSGSPMVFCLQHLEKFDSPARVSLKRMQTGAVHTVTRPALTQWKAANFYFSLQ